MRRGALLAVPLAVYAALEISAAHANADRINPDAVCYLRNALYWTEGRFTDAVSGYWSPLLSWCIAPLLASGMDALHAAYLVLGLWGAALVVASRVVLARIGGLPAWLGLIALVLIAECTVTWSATVFPDVILAACLMAYAGAALSPGLFEGRRAALAAGALGGLAYLAKVYGFPFFLLHWPLGVALLARYRSVAVKRALATGLIGLAAFAAVALPWCAALSWKLGTPTYGVAPRINHDVIGPNDYVRDALWQAVPGRVTVWEIPETRAYRDWSIFDGPASLRHQASYSWRTLKAIRGSLQRFDALSLGLAAVLLGPFVLAALGAAPREREPHAYALATVAAYALPFALVYFTYRYTAPWLKPLTILIALRLTWALAERVSRRLAIALVALVLLSFAAHVNVPFTPYTVEEADSTPFDGITVDAGPHRAMAAALSTAGLAGPIACTRYWAGMYVAYFLDAPFVGAPAGASAEACDAELRARGVATFLVDRTWRHAAAFASMPGWRLATTWTAPSGEVLDVYAAR